MITKANYGSVLINLTGQKNGGMSINIVLTMVIICGCLGWGGDFSVSKL